MIQDQCGDDSVWWTHDSHHGSAVMLLGWTDAFQCHRASKRQSVHHNGSDRGWAEAGIKARQRYEYERCLESR